MAQSHNATIAQLTRSFQIVVRVIFIVRLCHCAIVPLYYCGIVPMYYCTIEEFHNPAIPQSLNPTFSQSNILTFSQFHILTILQSHDFTMAQSHNATIRQRSAPAGAAAECLVHCDRHYFCFLVRVTSWVILRTARLSSIVVLVDSVERLSPMSAASLCPALVSCSACSTLPSLSD